jgi:beta-lactamase regulating signal transducer with metallopeptidase domain
MSTTVQFLNAWGGRFLHAAGPMLWQSGLLIAVVLALDWLLRKRVRATTRHALWLLVLLKLVMPTSLSLPTSLAYWLPAPGAFPAPRPIRTMVQPAIVEPQTPAPIPAQMAQAFSQAKFADQMSQQLALADDPGQAVQGSISTVQATNPPVPPARQTLQWPGAAALVWLAGMAALGAVLLLRARLTRRLVSGAVGTDEFSVMLGQCASRMGIRRRVSLKLTGALATPAVCGLFRPVILLPKPLAWQLDAGQLEAVILHELAHVRRGDVWLNYFQALLQIFYFYNPLLWLANAAIRRAREEAADELVLVAMGGEAALYPETLLQVAKFAMQTPRPGFGWVGILERRSTVGGRIRLMLNRPWPKSARLDIRGGIAVAAFAALLLPMSGRPGRPNPTPPALNAPAVRQPSQKGAPKAAAPEKVQTQFSK